MKCPHGPAAPGPQVDGLWSFSRRYGLEGKPEQN